MDTEILSGIVHSYGSKGDPVVKYKGRIRIITGFETAYKTPIGEVSEYKIIESLCKNNFDIGKTVNDKPSLTHGTICRYGDRGNPLMDCRGRVIFVEGYDSPPEIGSIKPYLTILNAPKFDVVWINDDQAFNRTVKRLISKPKITGFINACIRDKFIDTLLETEYYYNMGEFQNAISDIDKLYLISKIVLGGNIELANNLKFLKTKVENLSIQNRILSSVSQSSYSSLQ